jgi:DNA-binding XRE family transcriptional regulator
MITVLSPRHAIDLFRRMRLYREMTQAELGAAVFVDRKTIRDRETHRLGLPMDALIHTARVFGYDVALVPARATGARHTGTGWPA